MDKRSAEIFGIIGLLIVSNVIAGGWENRTNASAEFIQSLSRNASTDADAAYFNPAGITSFNDGIFMNIDNQFVNKNYSQLDIATGIDYQDSKPVLVLPNLQLGYKNNSWGAFLTFNVPAGGGSVLYNNGTATTAMLISSLASSLASPLASVINGTTTVTQQKVEASSAYYGISLGGATAITDFISVAAAGRMVLARNSTNFNAQFGVSDPSGQLTSDWNLSSVYDENANGFTGLINADIKPMQNMLIAVKYEFITRLEFEQENVNSSATMNNSQAMTAMVPAVTLTALETGSRNAVASLATDGAKYYDDLPAFFDAGISYRFIPQLETSMGVNYYFNKQARWEGIAASDIDNSIELSAGIRYDILPELKICAGYSYCNVGSNMNYYGVPEDAALNSNTIGAGISAKIKPDVELNIGLANTFFTELNGQSLAGPLMLDKKVLDGAIGISYFLGNKPNVAK